MRNQMKNRMEAMIWFECKTKQVKHTHAATHWHSETLLLERPRRSLYDALRTTLQMRSPEQTQSWTLSTEHSLSAIHWIDNLFNVLRWILLIAVQQRERAEGNLKPDDEGLIRRSAPRSQKFELSIFSVLGSYSFQGKLLESKVWSASPPRARINVL